MEPMPSNNAHTMSQPKPIQPASANPYARIPARRAIACVTCAKAKTKCDKSLPACSRCVTKGIKCEPRSTRRTSENNYRATPRKPFVTPKRYSSASVIPSMNRQTSPRAIPRSDRPTVMRAASHIDFRTAVKMSQQQASAISGYPTLSPLPTYQSPAVDECYSYTSSPEPSMGAFTPNLDDHSFPVSRGMTPQTPEPFVYHEPFAMDDPLDRYSLTQAWSDDNMMPIGLGFDTQMPNGMPMDMWSTPEPEVISHANQTSLWVQQSLLSPPQQFSRETTPNLPPLSTSDCSVDDFGSGRIPQDEWSSYHSNSGHINMNNLITSAPYVPNMKSIPGSAPVWEDVYLATPATY